MNLSDLPIPTGVTPAQARLAWELVSNITPLGDLMRRHELSFDELEQLQREPLFKRMLTDFRKHWDSELTVNQRVALKAALLTEDALLDVYGIIKDETTTPGQKMEAFAALAKAGEVGAPRRPGDEMTQTPVHITINVPGQAPLSVDAVPAIDVSAEPAPSV